MIPPHSLSQEMQQLLQTQLAELARELGVVGLINAQFAIQGQKLYILEVNPRASRTIPFIAKATGVPLAKIAARCMTGESLVDQGYVDFETPTFSGLQHCAIKQAVFPFAKFPGVDPILGPEMRSTGEVMGIAKTFGEAFMKGLWSIGHKLPQGGSAFVSVRDADKPYVVDIAKTLLAMNFTIVATGGTATTLQAAGLACERINKVTEGRPHVVDSIKNKEIDFIINTTEGEQAIEDSFSIRRSAIQHDICYTTTLTGGQAACSALQIASCDEVVSLQDLHELIEA